MTSLEKAAQKLMESIEAEANARQRKVRALLDAVAPQDGASDVVFDELLVFEPKDAGKATG